MEHVGTRFVGSSHWKIPRKSGKSKKVGPFSRLEFPNGMSCSIYVSRSLYQFQVHRRAPRRTRVYDQMEQLFSNRKFHICSHWNFRVVFLNGKRSQAYPCSVWKITIKNENQMICPVGRDEIRAPLKTLVLWNFSTPFLVCSAALDIVDKCFVTVLC